MERVAAMPTPHEIKTQINKLIAYLVEVGLADAQNSAFQRETGSGITEITFQGAKFVSIALKNLAYSEIYQNLLAERAYNLKLLDGALLQMMYSFGKKTLQRHRLAFFPAPHLNEFQNNPDVYLEDAIYADVVARNIVPFPIRFDYDGRDTHYRELVHPKSHLTLGQYEECRIPVSAPMMPAMFVDFIVRNFYHVASHTQYADGLPISTKQVFPDTIFPSEQRVVHVVLHG